MRPRNVLLCFASVMMLFGLVDSDLSDPCRKQIKIVKENWEILLMMVQASSHKSLIQSKYTSVSDFGNYDYCTSIDFREDNERILGKYCPFSVIKPALMLNSTPFTQERNIPQTFFNLQTPLRVEEEENMKEQFLRSLNQTVREGTSVGVSLISVCVPDACTPQEFLEAGLFSLLYGDWPTTPESFRNGTCVTKETGTDYSYASIAVGTIFLIIIAFIIISTSYDVFLHYSKKEPIHLVTRSFSILFNGRKLITTSNDKKEQILCISGIRVFSMMWVVAGHAAQAFIISPIQDREVRDTFQDRLYSQYLNAGVYAVDTFFFLSGVLLGYGYLKSVKDTPMLKQLQGFPLMILHRYLRLTPAVAALFFFALWIFPHAASGPLWQSTLTTLNGPCYTYWWRYFLYIQNYAPSEEMCFTHTWYLAADMQMFVLSPIVLIPASILVKKNFKLVAIGINALMVAGLLVSIGIRFAIPDYTNSYDSHSRFSDYLIGILAGIVIRTQRDKKFPFSKMMNILLWCLSLAVMVALMLAQHVIIRPDPDRTTETLFNVLYRPLWCYGLFWIVYSCYCGEGGFVNWFLSTPFFQVISKLTYCMYLTHVLAIVYFVGQGRTEMYFSDYFMFYAWCGHIITTTLVATLWTFAFESPMITIDRLIFASLGKKMSDGRGAKKMLPS